MNKIVLERNWALVAAVQKLVFIFTIVIAFCQIASAVVVDARGYFEKISKSIVVSCEALAVYGYRGEASATPTNAHEVKVDLNNGGGILTSAIQTITSIDGKSITINRDPAGGGWFDQSEVRTTYADGHRTLVITDKNADGSEIHQATTTVSIDGFTRSVGTDMDSDLLADRISTYALLNNRGGIGEAANDNQQQFARQLASWPVECNPLDSNLNLLRSDNK